MGVLTQTKPLSFSNPNPELSRFHRLHPPDPDSDEARKQLNSLPYLHVQAQGTNSIYYSQNVWFWICLLHFLCCLVLFCLNSMLNTQGWLSRVLLNTPYQKEKYKFMNRHTCCPYYQEKVRFMKVLNQCFVFYSGDRVAHIEMICCFNLRGGFSSGFSHWLQSISRLGVERLHLSFQCLPLLSILGYSSKLLTFSLDIDILSQASSLKLLLLPFCIVFSSPKVRFNSLMTLALHAVVLESGHLESTVTTVIIKDWSSYDWV